MDKIKITKLVLAKLEDKDLENLLVNIAKYIKDPRNIILLLQNFHKEQGLTPQESIKLMGKIQQKGLIDKSLRANKDSEKAWRLLLKNWRIPDFRLERGAY